MVPRLSRSSSALMPMPLSATVSVFGLLSESKEMSTRGVNGTPLKSSSVRVR